MGKYTAGDRVKILAGHPYWIGNEDSGEPAEGTYVAKEDRGYRAKHHVLVDVQDGEPQELSFKGSEIELIVAAAEPAVEAWVPKVGERVRLIQDNCGVAGWGRAGETGTVEAVDLACTVTRVAFDESGTWHAQFSSLEPVVASTTVKVGDRVWDVVDGEKINEATVSAVDSNGEFTVNWDDGLVGEYWWPLSAWNGHAPAAPAPANDNLTDGSVHTLTLTLNSEPLVDAFRTIAAALNKAADDIAA